MKKYTHSFSIVFDVLTDNDCDNVTSKELWEGLEARIKNLKESEGDEIIEACGYPFDTNENEVEDDMILDMSKVDMGDGIVAHISEDGTVSFEGNGMFLQPEPMEELIAKYQLIFSK